MAGLQRRRGKGRVAKIDPPLCSKMAGVGVTILQQQPRRQADELF
jgi:hypothetical protein